MQLSVTIVGHTGRMGAMLATRLAKAGFVVAGVDLRQAAGGAGESLAKAAETIARSQLVLLCVPVSSIPSVVRQVAPLMRTDQVLLDITSVKTLPMQWMEEAFAGPVIGTHPLFGPMPNPVDMRVALVRGKRASENHCALVERLFTSFGCACFWSDALEHDHGVAITQSLNFTVSALFFSTLSREKDVTKFLTPSFKRHLEAARKHLTDDAAMFCEFSSMNPCYMDALKAFRLTLDEVMAGKLEKIAKEAAVWYAERPA